VAIAVCALGTTALAQLELHPGGITPVLVGALQGIASALFLGAGVLRLSRFRLAGDQRSLRMGVALVVLGGIAIPLTGLAGVISSGGDSGSMLRPATAIATVGVVQLMVFRAICGPDHRRPHALRLLATACGAALLLFLGLVTLNAWWPQLLQTDSVPPAALRGATLAVVWLYVGLEAALRSEERPWAGKVSPLLGCMGVAELLRIVSAYHQGGWELAAAGLQALLAALVAHRALVDLDEATSALRLSNDQDAAKHHAWREEMAHDARNALAGLRAALVTLEKYDGVLDTDTSVRLRAAALGEISHLEHLIIRPDPVDPVDFDIAEVVTQVIDAQRANGASVELDVAPTWARGRPADLATALQNLVVNGRDHGGNRITIRTVRAGSRVELSVVDQGPGLSEAQIATLFQRGARGPKSRGSGLGLHVSRTLMRQQGGDLFLRDHVGGATFVITLPLSVNVTTAAVRRAETRHAVALVGVEAS
jgi:signal transduction histidine kinase